MQNNEPKSTSFPFLLPLKRNGEFLLHRITYDTIQKDHQMCYDFNRAMVQLGFNINEEIYLNHVLISLPKWR